MQLQCVAVEPVSLSSGASAFDKGRKQLISASGSGGAIIDLVFGAELVEVTRDGRVRLKVADAAGFKPGAEFALVPIEVEEPAPAAASEPVPAAETTSAEPAA